MFFIMNMINKYIRSNNTMKRYAIIDDIVSGKIDRSDIDDMCQEEQFLQFMVPRNISIKSNIEKWDYAYLYKITEDAISKGFNEEYLMHICDVARYVRTNQYCSERELLKKHLGSFKILAAGAVILAILIKGSK